MPRRTPDGHSGWSQAIVKITQVMVEFEKRINDGNYGSEKATAQYVAQVDEGDNPDEVIRQLVARGRDRVVAELKDSESISVRWALNPPKRLCAECGEELPDDEHSSYHQACREVRDARYKREAEEREARWRAEREPVGVGVSDDDDTPEDAPL
jgi:hypothetical protein